MDISVFHYHSGKDASSNKNWILVRVLDVLVDFFSNLCFQIKKLTGKFWVVSDTMAERTCDYVTNWLSSAGVPD